MPQLVICFLTFFVNFLRVRFITSCSQLLKNHGIGWVLYLDSDEFLFLNHGNSKNNNKNHSNKLRLTKESTVTDVINSLEPPVSSCITMPRLTFGALENTSCPEIEDFKRRLPVSTGLNFQQMATLQYLQHAKIGDFSQNKFGKVMMNLNNFTHEDLSQRLPKSPHRIFSPECGPPFVKHSEKTTLYIHHYLGSWERYFYSRKDDARRNRKEWENRAFLNDGIACDVGVHHWLERFIGYFGETKAKFLLS